MTKGFVLVAVGVCASTIIAAAGALSLPKGFEARFVQYVTNPQKKRIVYKGTIDFSAPSHLKWRYETPTKKEVCSDGESLVVVDYDLEQVSRYRMRRRFDLAKIVRNARKKSDRIYVTEYDDRMYTIRVDKAGRLESLAFYDELDNKVQIAFEKMRYFSEPPAKKRLLCRWPESFDIVRG